MYIPACDPCSTISEVICYFFALTSYSFTLLSRNYCFPHKKCTTAYGIHVR